VSAQSERNSDSLFTQLESTHNPQERIDTLIYIIDLFSDEDPKKALRYAKLALIESKNANLLASTANIYFKIGEILETDDQYDEAIANYRLSYNIYHKIEDEKWMGDLSYALADIYKKIGFYGRSMEKCLEGLRIYKNLRDTSGLSDIYNCMGSLYKYQEEIGKSIEYYGKSLELSIAKSDSGGMAQAYNNIGVVHRESGNNELAQDYYLRAIYLRKLKGDSEKNLAITYNNLALIYLEKKEYIKAYDYIMQSLDIHTNEGYKRGIASQYQSLGKYYDLTGYTDLAIENYLIAFDMFIELGRLAYLKNITATISDIYSRIGEFEKAYYYLNQNQVFSDSLFTIEKMKSLATLEQDYQQFILDEDHKLKDQRTMALLISSSILLILVLIIFSLLYSRQKSRINEHVLSLQNVNLEKKQVEYDLELRQKEIAASTINQVRKNEIIHNVINRLNNSLKNLKEENVPVVKEIIDELCDNTNPDVWKEFEVRFLQVHQNFYENLMEKFPDLSSNEKRLSAFLRLDFSSKEISLITNQSPHSINIARTRLRKKLGLSNTDTNLTTFLAGF
ncbi:MAG: tetratricopeptide repeat protein, partial [Bacteroidales bacterium]|nr:tetratricopeptide repeat protein [Bacteroidales bacterium]